MDRDSTNRQPGASDPLQGEPFSAMRWERDVAEQFLGWRKASGTGLGFMRSFADAVLRTFPHPDQQSAEWAEIASRLPAVLKSCDQLAFDDWSDAIAYAALHLVDRYGRVNQVLEHLIRDGRLPLRVRGVRVLEVGSGPAPALYATRDFYATLLRWPGLGGVKCGPLATFHALDRGRAWNWFLHHLSETLAELREGGFQDGSLGFGVSGPDLSGFDVRDRHRRSVEHIAARIAGEFDDADEPISSAEARRMAQEEGGAAPSAYDIVFLCNFLTQVSMTNVYERELHRLACSLTPGGLLIVMGGTGGSYPELYAKVRAIANGARLHDVSPPDAFRANNDADSLALQRRFRN